MGLPGISRVQGSRYALTTRNSTGAGRSNEPDALAGCARARTFPSRSSCREIPDCNKRRCSKRRSSSSTRSVSVLMAVRAFSTAQSRAGSSTRRDVASMVAVVPRAVKVAVTWFSESASSASAFSAERNEYASACGHISNGSSSRTSSSIWATPRTPARNRGRALPDLGFAPSTSKGVVIGDTSATVLARYGKPDEEQALPGGDRILRYRSSGKGYLPKIRNLLLVFWMREGKVRSLTLTGDIPGVKTPSWSSSRRRTLG